MAKPKSRRINRAGRKSLKKNRSRKSRRNKHIGGDEILNAGLLPKFFAHTGKYIPAVGFCKIYQNYHIINAVNLYHATDDKDKYNFKYEFSGCNFDGTTRGSLTTIDNKNIKSYIETYNRLIKN